MSEGTHDVVARLDELPRLYYKTYGENIGFVAQELAMDAKDEILALRSQNAEWSAISSALSTDNTRLREALEGLVSAVSDYRVKPEDMPHHNVIEVTVRRKDLVHLNEQFDIARAALSPAQKER